MGTGNTTARAPAVRVLVVDDHPSVRDGLRVALERGGTIEVVGEAVTAAEAVALARRLAPAVTLLDLSLPDARGAAAVRLLHAVVPATRLLVLTAAGQAETVRDCLEAGACGYLLKTSAATDVAAAVHSVAAGERVLDRHLLHVLLQAGGGTTGLTPRELVVLDAISRGLTNRQAATMLGLAESTVKTHLARSMTKLGVADRTEAVASLLRRGLLE